MEVTGRIPKNFTGLWMRVVTHKYLFIFPHCIYSWMGRQAFIFQINGTVLDFSFFQAKTGLGKKKCRKENHRAMRIEGCRVLVFFLFSFLFFDFSGLDLINYKLS